MKLQFLDRALAHRMTLIAKIWKAIVNYFRIEYEETKGDTTTRMMYRDEKKKRNKD